MAKRLARRVLVVDDDSDTAQLTAMLVVALQPRSQVRSAHDGLTALRIAHEWWPDLVITDIDMPLLNGIEAALRMRTEVSCRMIRIVAVTGAASWHTDPMALAVFDNIYLKPISVEHLQALL